MNMGAGLSAVGGFYQDQGAIKEADFIAKQRAYQIATQQAGLDSLPARTEAETASAKLASARSSAGLATLPQETDNTLKTGNLRGAGLDFDMQKLPGEQQIASAAQKYQMDNLPKTQQLAQAGLDRAVANIPNQDAAQGAAGTNAANEQYQRELLMFGQHLSANDKQAALKLANQVAAGKKNYIDVHAAGEQSAAGDNRRFELVADDGTNYQIPYSAISASMNRAKTGKYTMHEGRAGDVHVLNEFTGQLDTKVPADPNYVRTASTNQHTPAQLQLVNAYMAAPENKGMTFSQAMDKVKTSLEKPRHQAILDLVGKNLMPGGDPQKEFQKWADLYDHAKGGQSRLSSTPGLESNSPAASTIEEKYKNLFTP